MLILPDRKAVILKLRDPARVLSIIKSAKLATTDDGGKVVAVPHRPDEVRVLRSLGFKDVPDPMKQYYEFKMYGGRKPFEAQIESANFLAMEHRAYCLNDMGLGKTVTALWAYDYLRRCKEVRKAIVVCPLSTMERAWGDEIFRSFPHLSSVSVYGDRKLRLKRLAQDVDIYVINADGIKIIEEELAKRPDIDLVIIDELAMFRNAGTERWKSMNKICNKQVDGARRVFGLTGRPCPNSPEDAWAQCRLVNPSNPMVPKYFKAFQDMVMVKRSMYKWEPRPDAMETIYQCMQPAIRFKLDDCVDLPEQVIETREAEMTTEQRKAYKEMVAQLVTEYEGGQIVAVNEAVKLNKLIQIACGVAYGMGKEELIIPPTNRMAVLREVIEESAGKVLVFVPLTGVLNYVAEELRKNWSVEVVHGEVSKSQRDQIFDSFQKTAHPHVLVANPATMSHGLTLTAATTIVWFAPVHSNDIVQQANARVRRPGQTRATVIVQIAGSPVERKIYSRIEAKESLQGVLLDMMKELA